MLRSAAFRRLLCPALALLLTGCQGDPKPAHRGALTSIGGADYQSVEGGNTTVIRAASVFGCTDVGSPFSLPPNAVVATWGVGAFAASSGEDSARGSSWFLVGLAPFNTAGKIVQTGACVGDRFLVGSNFGLEWISKKDLTSGTFASTLFNGNGVTALLQTDATHILAGVLNTTGGTPSGVLVCDLSATTCNQAAAGFTGLNATDSVQTFFRFPTSGTILAGTKFSGAWRSTDAGLSWAAANSGFAGANNNLPAFVGSGNSVFVASSGGVYESTTDGQSWTKTSSGLGTGTIFPTSLAGDGTTMYAGLNSGNSDIPGTIWKTVNGAVNWQPAGAITAESVNSLAVTPGTVWAATNAGVLRSTDAGATWTPFNKGLNNTYVPRIVVSGGTLYAGTGTNSNGFFRSTDGGASWLPANALMNNRRIKAIAVSGSSIVASGDESTLGVYRSTDGGVTFALSRTGLPSNANAYSLLTVGTTIYAGLIPSGFARSTDGGASWTAMGSGLTANTVSALASSGGTLLAAAGLAVSRSTDGGATFTPGATLVPADHNYFVTSLAFNGATLFAGIQGFGGTDTHGLLQSADFGATWTRPQNGIPSNTDVYDITVSGARILAGTQAGIYASTDGGATWSSVDPDLSTTSVTAVAVSGGTIHAGTFGHGLFSIASPEIARRLLPVVLDVDNGSAHYTSEIALANRGTTTSSLTIQYTASLGAGSGTVTDSLSPGQQLILPDVIAYLRSKGLSIPSGGSQAGTLLVTFENLSDAEAGYATARTTAATSAPQPAGAAGLAYVSMDPAGGETTKLRLYGLRSNASDRSNVAVFNAGGVPVTLKVTAFSGDGSGASTAVDGGATLPPWGWAQYNRILDGPGYATGWVVVERTSTSGTFGAYAAINNNVTNDGSFVPGTTSDIRPPYMNVPVLVETPTFRSELELTNASPNPVSFSLTYFESLASGAERGRTPEIPNVVQIIIPAHTVVIQPEAVDWLRGHGAAVGPKDAASYAGMLHIEVAGALINDTHAGARTAAQSPAGGQFGFFAPARLAFDEATSEAWVYGLKADANNRSNLALSNTGSTSAAGNITVRADVFDGKTGGTSPSFTINYSLQPGEWKQANNILGQAHLENGYVHLTRTAGTAPYDGYVVTNDGGNPGERTGDGAWYPITVRYTY